MKAQTIEVDKPGLNEQLLLKTLHALIVEGEVIPCKLFRRSLKELLPGDAYESTVNSQVGRGLFGYGLCGRVRA